jgi:hypothetical protein
MRFAPGMIKHVTHVTFMALLADMRARPALGDQVDFVAILMNMGQQPETLPDLAEVAGNTVYPGLSRRFLPFLSGVLLLWESLHRGKIHALHLNRKG